MNTNQQVAPIEPTGDIMPPASPTPMDVLNRAIAQGVTPKVIAQLMGLQERWERNQARKEFDAAMASAKAEIPVIKKNRQVGFESKKAGSSRTDYKHEDLGEIARTVDPILSKYGLSYRYRTESPINAPVSCIIAHRGGYSEENTLSAGRDDTGNKNNIQAIGSTVTYLQRYTLKAALGLAAAAVDDDGEASTAIITDEQVSIIQNMLAEVQADLPMFLKFVEAESVDKIQARNFDKAIQALGARKANLATKKAKVAK